MTDGLGYDHCLCCRRNERGGCDYDPHERPCPRCQTGPRDQRYPMCTVPGRYGGLLRFTRMSGELLITVDDELGGTAMQANIHVDPDDTMDLVGFLQQKENNG